MRTENKVKEVVSSLLPFRMLLVFYFITISGSLVALGIIFFKNNEAFIDTDNWVKHTHAVIEKSIDLSGLTKDLQLELGTYSLTKDNAALRQYYNNCKTLKDTQVQLEELTSDNPTENKGVKDIRKKVDLLIHYSDSIIALRKERVLTIDEQISGNKQRRIFRTEINRLINKINKEERRLLVLRENSHNEIATVRSLLYEIFAVVGFLLLSGLCVVIYYHFRKRQQAEKEIKDSETRYRSLVNGIKDLAIFMIDDKGYILNWNKGAEMIKGYKAEEIIGRHISIFYTSDAIKNGEPEQNMETARQQGSFEVESWRVRKDGSIFWADVLITALYDDEGNIQNYIKITRDYSTHRKAEEEIKMALEHERELNEMKSRFVSMASHEFRTPLSSVLTSASLIESYDSDNQREKRHMHINRIKASVKVLVGILNDFLSFDRLEQGKVGLNIEEFNLTELCDDVIDEVKDLAKEGQQIRYTHAGEKNVTLDKRVIKNILLNLFSNAIKYSDKGKEINLVTAVTFDRITIKMKDEGIGIPEEEQKNLFSVFYRARNVTTIQGTGLGLNIVRKYVEMLNGIITFTSRQDEGTTFTIQFPVNK